MCFYLKDYVNYVFYQSVYYHIANVGIFKIRCKKNRENFILVLTIC